MSLILFVSMVSVSSAGNPFDKAKKWVDKKVVPEVKKVEEKVGAWIENRKEANPEEMKWLREQSAELKRVSKLVADDVKEESGEIWDDIEVATNRTYKKVEDYTAQTWEDWTKEKEEQVVAPPQSELSKNAKILKAQNVYNKISQSWLTWLGPKGSIKNAKKDDELIQELEEILAKNELSVSELIYATNDKKQNLVHLLVKLANEREKLFVKKKLHQKANLDIEEDSAFQHALFLISVLCKSASLAVQKDAEGNTPIGLLLKDAPINWNLVEFVVVHDGSEMAAQEMKAAVEQNKAKLQQ